MNTVELTKDCACEYFLTNEKILPCLDCCDSLPLEIRIQNNGFFFSLHPIAQPVPLTNWKSCTEEQRNKEVGEGGCYCWCTWRSAAEKRVCVWLKQFRYVQWVYFGSWGTRVSNRSHEPWYQSLSWTYIAHSFWPGFNVYIKNIINSFFLNCQITLFN